MAPEFRSKTEKALGPCFAQLVYLYATDPEYWRIVRDIIGTAYEDAKQRAQAGPAEPGRRLMVVK